MIAACVCGAQAQNAGRARTRAKLSTAGAVRALPLLPLSFEANRGQADARVRFLSRGPGYTLFLLDGGAVLRVARGRESQVLRLTYEGAQPAPQIQGVELSQLRSNYFIGNDPAKWQTNVPNYGRVLYKPLYRGVDLAFYGSQGRLENDYLLAPGANASRICLRIEGARSLRVNAQGDLVLATVAGEVNLLKPRAYQEISGKRREVAASYRISAGNRISFALGAYDHKQPLVIDPVIDFMTYVTNATALTVGGVAADASGNTYVAGTTSTLSFTPAPTSSVTVNPSGAATGGVDIFVLKLSSDGTTAQLADFLGSTGDEVFGGITVGSNGNVYLTGTTPDTGAANTNFPIGSSLADSAANFVAAQAATAGGNDVFLAKLSGTTGSLLYSTFLGDSSDDAGNAVAVVTPYAFLTGTAGGTGFPTHNGSDTSFNASAPDAFLESVNTNVATGISSASCTSGDIATLNFSGNPGFSSGDRVVIKGVPPAPAHGSDYNVGSAVVTLTAATSSSISYSLGGGGCHSNSDPIAGPTVAGTVAGQFQYGTYIRATTIGHAIAATDAAHVYIAGETTDGSLSTGGVVQTALGGGTDAWAALYDTTQSGSGSLIYRTYLGGAGKDVASAIQVDGSGNAYVVGTTSSTETNGQLCKTGSGATCFLQPANGGGNDAFVVKLNSGATAILWSTYLGGSGNEQATSAALDSTHNLLFVGGSTASASPGSPAATTGTLHGTQDGFVAVIGAVNTASSQTYPRAYFLGGMGTQDVVAGLALDSTGRLYAGGNADSLDLTSQTVGTTASAYQTTSALDFDLTHAAQPAQLGFAARINADYANPAAATLTAPETITNLTAGQTGTNNVYYCGSCSTKAGVVHYSYAITAAGATANDVVFNWPAPRTGGTVVGVPVINGGTGYTVSHTYTNGITFTDPGGGTGAVADVITNASGVITQINITNAGSAYSSQTTAALNGTVTTAGTAATLDVPLVKPGSAYLTTSNLSATSGTCTNAATDADSANPGVTCVISSIATGTPVTVSFDATAQPAATATSGSITFAAAPTIGAANAALSTVTSGTITSLPTADIVATQSAASAAAVHVTAPSEASFATNQVTFTVHAQNTGPGDATVTIDDLLPKGFIVTAGGVTGGDAGLTAPWSPAGQCDFATTPSIWNSTPDVNGNTHFTCSGGLVGGATQETQTITITGYFDAGVGLGANGSVSESNSVTASSSGASIDGDPGNNTDSSITVTVHRDADLAVAATDNTGVTAQHLSGSVQFTTTITNNGPDDATGIVVSYGLPDNTFTIDAVNTTWPGGANCQLASAIVTCNIASLPALAGTNSVQYVLAVHPGANSIVGPTGTVNTSIAVASTDVNDGTAGNNTVAGGVTSNLDRAANLTLSQISVFNGTNTSTPNASNARSAMTGTLTLRASITNGGPDDANNVHVVFTLPTANYTVPVSGFSGFSACTPAGANLDCAFGNLANGASATPTVQINPNQTDPLWVAANVATQDDTITGEVSSTTVVDNGPGGAPNTTVGENDNTTTAFLMRSSDLQITTGLASQMIDPFTAAPNTANDANHAVNTAGTLIYPFTFKNAGPDDAVSVKVFFTFPTTGYVYVSNSGNLSGCTYWDVAGKVASVAATTTYACDLGALANNASASVELRVKPDPAWTLSAPGSPQAQAVTAQAISYEVFDNGALGVPGSNNSDSKNSFVGDAANLQTLTFSDNTQVTPATLSDPGTVYDRPLTYSATINNAGPDNAPSGVQVVFALAPGPNGAAGTSYTVLSKTFPGACTPVGLTLTCSVGTLNAGSSASYSVSLQPDSTWVDGTHKNNTVSTQATVSSAVVFDNGANGAPGADNNPPNNSGTNLGNAYPLISNVQRTADLGLSALTNSSTIKFGAVPLSGPVKLSVPVQDFGPDDAANAVVTLTMPATGWVIDNANTTFTGGCTGGNASTTITCTVTSLTKAAGAQTYDLAVTPPSSLIAAEAPILNPATDPSASVIFPTPTAQLVAQTTSVDPLATNNSASAPTVTVKRESDLQVQTVSDNGASSIGGLIANGQPYVLTSTVRNLGDDPAPDVNVTYTFPDSAYTLTNGSTSPYPGGCSSTAPGVYTCIITQNGATMATGVASYKVHVTPSPNLVGANQSSNTFTTNVQIQATKAGAACCTLDGNSSNDVQSPITTVQRITNVTLAQTDVGFDGVNPTSIANPASLSGPLVLKTTANFVSGDPVPAFTVVYTFTTGAFTLNSSTYEGGCTHLANSLQVTCSAAPLSPLSAGSLVYQLSVNPDPAWVPTTSKSATESIGVSLSGPFTNTASASLTTNVPQSSLIARYASVQITAQSDEASNGSATTQLNPASLGGPLKLDTTVASTGPDDVPLVTVTYDFDNGKGSNFTVGTNNFPNGCAKNIANAWQVICRIDSPTPKNTSFPYFVNITPDSTWIPVNQQTAQELINSTVNYQFNTSVTSLTGQVNSWIGRVADVEILAVGDSAPATSPHPGQASAATNPVALSGPLTLTTKVNTNATIANATVSYVFPTAGFALVSNTYSGCAVNGGNASQVDCNIATLSQTANGTSFSLSVTPDPAWLATNQQTAPVSVAVNLAYPLNSAPLNTITGTIGSTVGRISDLRLASLTDNSATVVNSGLGSTKVVPLAGPLVYTAQVLNAGPDAAVGDPSHLLAVTFTLPNANYSVVSNTFTGAAGCVQNSATVVCDLGSLIAKNGTASGTLTVTPDATLNSVTSTFPNQIANAQVASADVYDDSTLTPGAPGTNNSFGSGVNTTLARFSNLSLAGGLVSGPTNVDSTGANFANVGSPVTYTLSVANAATTGGGLNTSAAAGVNVDVNLPAGFVGASTNSSNWNCIFTNHPSCTYNGTVPAGGSVPLVISGSYSDDPLLNPLAGGGTYNGGANTYLVGQGNGGAITATPGTTMSSNPDTLTLVSTSSNIERVALLSVTKQVVSPAVPGTVPLGQAIVYSFQVGNAGQCAPSVNCDKAVGIDMQVTFPAGFQGPPGFTNPQFASQPSGAWSCTWTANTLVADCKLTSLDPGVLSDTLTVTGSYSTALDLASGSGQLQVTSTGNVVTNGSINSAAAPQTAVSVAANIQRSVDLASVLTATPVVGGAAVLGQTQGGDPAKNTVTYTASISNSGANDASGGSTTDFNAVQMAFSVGALASHFNLSPVQAPSGVTCTTGQGTVNCHYANQATGAPATVIQITGQFDSSVSLSGSALSTATLTVSSTDSKDSNSSNDTATAPVTVVDTPVSAATGGSLVVRSDTANPTQVLYSSVTTAGVTTQSVVTAAPSGYVEPAATATANYSTATPQYEVVGMDSTLPVQYSGPVMVCVSFTPSSFVNPSRVRLFEQTGADITNSLNTTTGLVCGNTATIPNAFTVREPQEHLPVAKITATQLVVGGGAHQGTSNQFTIDAGGSADPDFQQLCNGSSAHTNPQFCGDTLTYTIKGPVGMGISAAAANATWSPDFSTVTFVVPPNSDGSMGPTPSFVGTFPVGVSVVALTVTDQTGAVVNPSQTATVNVALNSFTLGGGNTTSATINAGQSTNFQFSPQQTINGIQLPATFSGAMTLTCNGVKDDNQTTLAQNGMTCTMSPSTITQGESASVLITTTGPNFSMIRPVKPGSHNGMLLAVLAMMSFPAFGFVLLPAARRHRKGAALLLLLLAALLMLQTACGGGATQPVAQTVAKVTPSGTYTITVTGTAGSTVSTSTFKVTVQ